MESDLEEFYDALEEPSTTSDTPQEQPKHTSDATNSDPSQL